MKKDTPLHDKTAQKTDSQKKPYVTPQVVEYGSISQLTQGTHASPNLNDSPASGDRLKSN
jgi:hypothetical protein